ncbi:[protein-PII] uridylyltransferase [Inquilinus sp. CAU 1745]|uniref:[protein-PII] uridylyltransferase n=1 Tax=Inquilinus sp. CAU 1745 TaxID=3140369 RepID=UPI00325BACAE
MLAAAMLNMFKKHQAPDAPADETIADHAAIVQPLALADRLTDLARSSGAPADARNAILKALREALEDGRTEIRRRFLEELTGGDACVTEQVYLMDRIVRALADVTVGSIYPAPNPTVGERFAIVAIGGYGRGELAPQSDIDLLFLLPYKRNAQVEQVVEFMLYMLWDLGLKVGHAVRSVDESIRGAKADITVRTSLLESRALWGERALYEDLRRRFVKEIAAGTGPEFVEAKLAERDARHDKMIDSRYVLEPNIKEGKGGLRDLQTLYWIGKYLYQVDDVEGLVRAGVLIGEEAERFEKAQTFLRTVRCHLHYLTGRPEDRLTFDTQAEIGRRMGYTDHAGASGVERFMKHYFLIAKDVGDLTRIFCATLEAESQRAPRRMRFLTGGRKTLEGFVVEGERLTVADDRQFRAAQVDMIRLFQVAQANDLDIHPHALRLITRSLRLIGPKLRRDPEANRLFLEILTSPKDPELALRRMNEAGVLGRFLPDFGRVVAQMQYDMYHVFTVDEHTLFAIGIVYDILSGQLEKELPTITRVGRKIVSKRALYVAMLLHDIAKGRGGDHSVLGAKVARKLCPQMGLDDEETETVEWLVRWHLLMSDTAFKRDIEDDQTIRDFVAQVESPERLRLLLVLTTADIRAVGPGRWNAWKGTLLNQLFYRARDMMSGGFDGEGREQRIRAAQAALRERLADWPAAEIDAFLAMGYAPYWLSLDPPAHERHARLVRAAERDGNPLTVDTRVDREAGVTEVTLVAADHPGLFSRLAGALALAGADIVDAKIFTLANGMAVDVFSVQDAGEGGAFESPDKLARLAVIVERSLSGEVRPIAELAKRKPAYPARTRVFRVQPRVLIDNDASRTHTVVEVNGRDRPGLLYDVTRAVTGLNLQISSAKISTYGERAIDVFYVKDVFGLKITHEAKLARIRETLLEALVDPEAPSTAERKPPVRPKRRRRAARRVAETA